MPPAYRYPKRLPPAPYAPANGRYDPMPAAPGTAGGAGGYAPVAAAPMLPLTPEGRATNFQTSLNRERADTASKAASFAAAAPLPMTQTEDAQGQPVSEYRGAYGTGAAAQAQAEAARGNFIRGQAGVAQANTPAAPVVPLADQLKMDWNTRQNAESGARVGQIGANTALTGAKATAASGWNDTVLPQVPLDMAAKRAGVQAATAGTVAKTALTGAQTTNAQNAPQAAADLQKLKNQGAAGVAQVNADAQAQRIAANTSAQDRQAHQDKVRAWTAEKDRLTRVLTAARKGDIYSPAAIEANDALQRHIGTDPNAKAAAPALPAAPSVAGGAQQLPTLGYDQYPMNLGGQEPGAAAVPAAPVAVRSDQDHATLPRGTRYVGPDGQMRVKQ